MKKLFLLLILALPLGTVYAATSNPTGQRDTDCKQTESRSINESLKTHNDVSKETIPNPFAVPVEFKNSFHA